MKVRFASGFGPDGDQQRHSVSPALTGPANEPPTMTWSCKCPAPMLTMRVGPRASVIAGVYVECDACHERAFWGEAWPWLNRLYDLDAEAPLLTQPEQHRLARLLGRPLCGRRGEGAEP